MKKIIFYMFVLMLSCQFGCDVLDSENENNLSEVQVSVSNMPHLTDSSYVGWLTRIGEAPDTIKAAIKIFRLTIDQGGNYSQKVPVEFGYFYNANSFLITIEPDSSVDSSLNSNRVAMYGRILNGSAKLNYTIKDQPLPDPFPTGDANLFIDVVK